MKTRSVVLVSLVLLSFAASTRTPALPLPRTPGRSPGEARGGLPATIVNRVLDLLDHSVLLEQGTDHQTWKSPAIDTSQFDTIVVKVADEATSGIIDCQIAWQLGPDDTFVDPLDYSDNPTTLFLLRGETPVRGTAAQVFCHATSFSILGDDRGGDPPSPPGVGTITDVKVLLRRK